MVDTIDNATLDGVNDFTLFGQNFSWAGYPDYFSAYAGGPAGTSTVNLTASGNWFINGLELNGDLSRNIVSDFSDTNDGFIRYIGQYRLFEGNHTINLTNTEIQSIAGIRDANYDFSFGQFAQSVWLRSGESNSTNITLGNGAGIVRAESGTNTLIAAGGFADFIRLGRYGEAGTNTVSSTSGVIKNIELYGTTHAIEVGSADIRNIKINDDGLSANITANSTGEIDVLQSYVDTTITASSYIRMVELGDGDDVLFLSGGARQITLGDGTNTLNISDGNIDILAGFGGNDTINMSGGFIGAAELAQGNNVVELNAGKIVSVLTGNGTDVITVNSGQIVEILSDGGDDVVTVNDDYTALISVGAGNDTVIVQGNAGLIDTWIGNDTVTTGAGYVRSITTGDGMDVVSVGSGANTGGFAGGQISTGAGNDIVNLGNGLVSSIQLGAGDDILNIAATSSTAGAAISGFDGIDLVDFSGTSQAININLNFDGRWQNIGNMSNSFDYSTNEIGYFAFYSSVENLTGTAFNDILRGRGEDLPAGIDGANTMLGGFGDDEIYGLTGDDVLNGEGGADTLFAGLGNDTLFGEGGEDILLSGAGDDVADGGLGNDTIYGGVGFDILRGGVGDDRLYGGTNADRLNGGKGSDLLYGEGGLDVFEFDDINNNGVDRIKDWEDGLDKIDLSGQGFGSFADVLAISATFNVTDVRIFFAPGHAIVIENFALGNLDTSDIIL